MFVTIIEFSEEFPLCSLLILSYLLNRCRRPETYDIRWITFEPFFGCSLTFKSPIEYKLLLNNTVRIKITCTLSPSQRILSLAIWTVYERPWVLYIHQEYTVYRYWGRMVFISILIFWYISVDKNLWKMEYHSRCILWNIMSIIEKIISGVYSNNPKNLFSINSYNGII